MNGLSGSRRLARPVRLTLTERRGGDLDGAWWPHTPSVAQELPGLIECLHKPLGEIVDIAINWPVSEGPLDLDTIVNGVRSLSAARFRRPRLMVVDGRDGCLRLLVVPHMTSPALGAVVMRYAAAMPVRDENSVGALMETAELVVRAARDESAKWTARMREASPQSVKGRPTISGSGSVAASGSLSS